MPDILTHILFAEGVKDLIEDSNIKQFIDDNENLFNLAAQGPDFLFYYKPWNPFAGSIREAGEKMHHIETGKFFIDVIEKLKTLTGSEYEMLLVYTLGFLCHYFCDKTAHPYVYSMIEAGCYTLEGERKELSHYEIEATIDTRLWSEEKRISASRTSVADLLKVGNLPEIISTYISKYIYDTQDTVISNTEINRAVANMLKVLKILFDPENRKKKIINKLPLPRKCYVEGEFADVDVLNLKKRPWVLPGHKDIIHVASVGELLSGAIHECALVVNEVIQLLENGTELDLESIIPNEDYCTRETL